MAARIDTSPARGTRDVLPDEVALRDHALAVILATYARHGYAHVETPVLESLELLSGSQGGENEKLIFRVLKRGQKLEEALERLQSSGAPPADAPALVAELADFGLRYDLTVPLARYYAQNHGRLPQPFKAIQIGPVFRAERPQKGRYRQFTQVDIDVLGEAAPVAEVDLIAATTEALAALGLSGFSVRVNDRRLLTQLAEACSVPAERHEAVFIALDKLDKLGWDGVEAELAAAGLDGFAVASLRRGLPAVQELVACAATGGDAPAAAAGAGLGDPTAARELSCILSALTAGGVLPEGAQVLHDPTLVRGMGYYTGPIFEIGVEGLPFSLAGGGRYDRMLGRLLGREVPACGFSIGFERLVLVLQEAFGRGALPGLTAAPAVAVLCEPDEPGPALLRAARLRGDARGFRVSLVAARPAKKRGKQLDELQRQGFAYFVAPDADELRPLSSGGGTSR